VQPQGQLGLVLGLGHLTVDHSVVEVLTPLGQLGAAPVEVVDDTDRLGQELLLTLEIRAEDLVGEPTEECRRPAPQAPGSGHRLGDVGQSPVMMEILECGSV
jgi:hypothetical protein